MQNITISGLNLDIQWKEKKKNFKLIENSMKLINTDLILLPEMFPTGFYMKPEEVADRNSETLEWMKKFAKEKNCAVAGSASIMEEENFYNRFYFVEPNGN